MCMGNDETRQSIDLIENGRGPGHDINAGRCLIAERDAHVNHQPVTVLAVLMFMPISPAPPNGTNTTFSVVIRRCSGVDANQSTQG